VLDREEVVIMVGWPQVVNVSASWSERRDRGRAVVVDAVGRWSVTVMEAGTWRM
jgi:hypothetical protein